MDLLIAFVAAWILRAVWEEKAADLDTARSQNADQVRKGHPDWAPARRAKALNRGKHRHTAGWVAYQLRNGWFPTIGDVIDGYRAARLGHAEWLKQRPPKPEGKDRSGRWSRWREAWRAGRAGAAKRFAAKAKHARSRAAANGSDPAPQTQAQPEPAKATASPEPATNPAAAKTAAPEPANAAARPHPAPRPNPTRSTSSGTRPAPTIEREPMAGETGGYAGAQQLTSGYRDSLAAAGDQLEQYEAELLASGPGKDPQVMGTLAEAREKFAGAQTAFASHAAALNAHEQGAEYASDKGQAAATTEWLGAG